MNNTALLNPSDCAFFDKNLLETAYPELVYGLYSNVRDLPSGQFTETIKFKRNEKLSVATTPIQEGVTPVGSSMNPTFLSAEVKLYGDWQKVTNVAQWTSDDRALREVSDSQGEQAGRTLDTIVRDVITAGTNKILPSTYTLRSQITSSDKLSTTLLDEAITNLLSRDAKPFTKAVNPDNGYLTTPLNSCFIGINSTDINMDGLTVAAGWKPLEMYMRNTFVLPGEVGAYKRIRFCQSSIGKMWADAGSGSAVDVYATLILGKNAYITSRLSGHAMQQFIVPAVASSENPMALYGTAAWTASFACVIENDNNMVRIEHALL